MTETARRLLVAIGPAAERAAVADPRSKGKELVTVARYEDVRDVLVGVGKGGSALIATPAEELTYRAVEFYSDASVATGTPIGVLPVGDDGTLLGARTEPAPPAAESGALYCHFRHSFDCDVEFGKDEVDGFVERMSAGVEAAVFHGHGNGADLQLGSHVICVQADDLHGNPGPGDLALPCQRGGACRLSHLPIKAYWGARALRARVVVLVSCWGYLPVDGLLSPEALLGTALLRGPNVEAFIATTRVTYNTPELAQAALAFLEMGGSAGELTLLLNRFPGTASPPYVCMGDPDVQARRADGRAVRHDCAPAPAVPVERPAPEGMGFEELADLEESVRHAELPAEARSEILAAFGPVLKDGRRANLSAETLAAVTAARTAGVPAGRRLDQVGRFRALTALTARHTGNLPPQEADAFWDLMHGTSASPEELDKEWCRIQTMLLRHRGPDQLGYLSSISQYRDERLDTEPGLAYHLCGKRMFRITVEFMPLDNYERDLCFCERCGLIADLPAGIPAPFLAGCEEGVRVEGSPWSQAWLTGGIVPVGPSLLPTTVPRLATLSEPLPLPDAASDRRYGVALVQGGDHLIIQTPLPPFAPAGTPGERTNVWRTVS